MNGRHMTSYYGTARANLPDPPLIREQLFLLAHDEDRNLRPWIHLPALGVGLAGAALLDLLISAGPRPSPGSDAPPSPPIRRDPGTQHVLHHLAGVLPAVLREIGPGLYDKTSAALTARGYIVQDRRWGRGRYHLADVSPLIRIRAKVRHRITDRLPDPTPDIEALCALIWALNMPDCLIFDLSRADLDAVLHDVTARMPDWADPGNPSTCIPQVARAVREAVAHLALAAF